MLRFFIDIKETRAWKRLQAAQQQNSILRTLPARAMEVVQEVVGTLRVSIYISRKMI